MMCKKPFVKGVSPFGCGQCLPCRIKDRRIKVHRMMLENLKHSESSFVTVTYDDEHLPPGGTLVPRDTQLFIKRLRKAVYPTRLRYFLVGEYGEQSERPHYHFALFGLGPEFEPLIERAWGKGFVYSGDLTKDSASYIAGYVTKKIKLTNKNNPKVRELLRGRHPEFSRSSNRPGIGALAIDDIASVLDNEIGNVNIDRMGDVPNVLRHGNKLHPLGRYLRKKLREKLQFTSSDLPKEKLQEWKQEMCQLYEDYLLSAEDQESYRQRGGIKKMLLEKNKQKILSLEKRFEIFNQKGVL